MKLGPDGSLSKITSTVKERCKIRIIQTSNDAQNSVSPLYKLVCIDAEKNQHESLSETSEDEMDCVFELSDVTQDKERESINDNHQQENLIDKGHADESIYKSNRDAQSSFSSSTRSWSHKRRNAVRGKRNFRNNYTSGGISTKYLNVSNKREISPWLTEDQRLTMSCPYNQLPFRGCPNESFIPNQLKPDSMSTGLLGDSPFSFLSRPPNFQELNQTTHGSPNFYYDKPVAAQSGIPDHRHWRDIPIVKPNQHPRQPYWNNEPAPNQATETMFWNKEQHSNWGVTNDEKYWNDESIGPEPPFWNEGYPEGYSRPGPPDRKVHTKTVNKKKYHHERFQNRRNLKFNHRRWRQNRQKKQNRKHEWRKMGY